MPCDCAQRVEKAAAENVSGDQTEKKRNGFAVKTRSAVAQCKRLEQPGQRKGSQVAVIVSVFAIA